jgi:hypothetical protein
MPFTFHSKTGEVPPLKGVAASVTDDETQTGLADEVIETLTGMFGFTVMLTVFEMAGNTDWQETDEKSLHDTASPFAGT